VTSVSVCLFNSQSKNHSVHFMKFLHACCLQPWLGPPPMTIEHIIYLQLSEWCHYGPYCVWHRQYRRLRCAEASSQNFRCICQSAPCCLTLSSYTVAAKCEPRSLMSTITLHNVVIIYSINKAFVDGILCPRCALQSPLSWPIMHF